MRRSRWWCPGSELEMKTPPRGGVFACMALCLLRLRFSTGCGGRDKTGNTALPCFERPPLLELDCLAHDRFAAFAQGRELLPHDCKRHAHLLGDLEIKALAMSFQALQGFSHGNMSPKRRGVELVREKKRPREVGVFFFALASPRGFEPRLSP